MLKQEQAFNQKDKSIRKIFRRLVEIGTGRMEALEQALKEKDSSNPKV